MKFSVEKFVFEALVHKSGGLLSTRDIQPVLKNFLVEANIKDDDFVLKVIGCDTELSAVASTSIVEIEESGRVLLPGGILKGLVKEAPDGLVTVELKEEKCVISAGSARWELGVGNVEEYPPVPVVEELEKIALDKVQFLRAYGKVSYAAARDTLRPSYQLMDICGNKIRATDGAQFQQVDFESSGISVSVPIRAVDQLVTILRVSEEDEFFIAVSDSYIAFLIGNDYFLSLKSQHVFPNVDSWITLACNNNVEVSVDKQELLSAVRRVRVVADVDSNTMILTLGTNSVVLECRDKYGNWAKQDLGVFYEGVPRRIGVHSQFFYNLCKAVEGGSVKMFLSESLDIKEPLVFKDERQFGILNQLKI